MPRGIRERRARVRVAQPRGRLPEACELRGRDACVFVSLEISFTVLSGHTFNQRVIAHPRHVVDTQAAHSTMAVR